METPTLASERLRFRPILMGDIDFIFELFGRSETNRYSEDPDVKTLEEAVAMYEKYMKPGGESRFRVLIEDLSGEPMGTIGMYLYSKEHKRAEMGYDLMKEHWGKEYMTEAVGAMVSYGFNVLGLERIEATVDSENGASARVLEKNGFKHEGTMRRRFYHDGKWHDEMVLGLLKSD
jgi:ribosomal-protein-alanine N-acetyltransferase